MRAVWRQQSILGHLAPASPVPGPQGRDRRQSRRRMRQQVLTEYLALREQFGDVVRLPIRSRPTYLVSHPEAIQHVLRDQASQYRKGVLFKPIATLQGQGLLTSEGDVWRQHHRVMQPAFQPRQVAHYSAVIVQEAQAVIQGWQQAINTGKPLNVSAWMHRLTFRVTGRILCGLAPERLDSLAQHLQPLARPLLHYFSARSDHRWALPDWIPTPKQRRVHQAVAAYNRIAQQLMDERYQALQDDDTPASDVLADLLRARAATPGMISEQQVRDEVITLIGAGVETSALALSWTWYLLAQHPEVTAQLWQELDTALGGRPPTPADLPHLPYSRMILDEALRLYPPSAVLPRQANQADTLGGYTIPQDAVIILSPYVTHRHPDFWPDPAQFCPQRFSAAQVASRHRFAYLPFGAGPRVCIGQHLALLEMHLTLATLAQACSLQLHPERPVVPVLATTLRPGNGLWMTVQARP